MRVRVPHLRKKNSPPSDSESVSEGAPKNCPKEQLKIGMKITLLTSFNVKRESGANFINCTFTFLGL